ncbi:MAG TPA: helix-turn-helix transcriptional regulator [Solirubrobacterales bacterium]|nr:helix-turn-helix transcriptional regulator [Solirubrobacterales bacterium]
MSLQKRFGANLRRARRDAGLSQGELSRRSEVHRTQISNMEVGKRLPRLDTLLKLIGALEIPAAVLFEGMTWQSNIEDYGSFEVEDG